MSNFGKHIIRFGVIFVLVGAVVLSIGCTSEREMDSELVTEASITGMDAAELETVVGELDSLIEVILSVEDSSNIQSILDQFVAASGRELVYLYYGEADDDFWISPETELPPDYAFSQRPVYMNAAEQGVYVAELYTDFLTNRVIQTISKAVIVEGEVVGVIGIDCYVD